MNRAVQVCCLNWKKKKIFRLTQNNFFYFPSKNKCRSPPSNHLVSDQTECFVLTLDILNFFLINSKRNLEMPLTKLEREQVQNVLPRSKNQVLLCMVWSGLYPRFLQVLFYISNNALFSLGLIKFHDSHAL